MLRILSFLSFLTLSLPLSAQKLSPEVHLLTFCDNREYYNTVHNYSQTFLGTALNASLKWQYGNAHSIQAGFSVNKDAGTKRFIDRTAPLIHYNYFDKGLSFKMGLFSRDTLLKEYPLFLLNDTLAYYRPYLQGMFLGYQKGQLKLKVWMDWQQKIDSFKKECFLYGFAGKWQSNHFYIATKSTLYHLANAFVRDSNDHIHGQFANYTSLGLQWQPSAILSSIRIAAGPVYAADVHRTFYAYYPFGILLELEIKRKNLFLKNTYYRGDGFNLVFGDSFYRSKEYDRLDGGFTFGKGDAIRGKFTYSLHFIENRINHQQALTVYCTF